MAAGIAHDLNNTLALVLGQLELARLTGPSSELQEILGSIETAASDGAATVKRLQSFARPKGTSPPVPCDLAAVVREAVELARPRWQTEPRRRGVEIRVETELDGLPPIQGYPPEIREALTNLIFNAVDAMPGGGTIRFAGRLEPGGGGQGVGDGAERPSPASSPHPPALDMPHVELTVADTGVGMSAEIQAKVFEPFFTTKGAEGTGLGLSVVYGIMQRHEGSIAVTSLLERGTSFTLRFRPAPALAQPPPPVSAPPVLQAAYRILIVDDEPGVRRTLGRLLTLAGHSTLEAADGPSALGLLASAPVDCVLTDLSMPGMSGYTLAQAVKAAHPGLPVILLSGWQDAEPEAEAGRAAVDAVLEKPLRIASLLEVIRGLMQEE
jgi:CheY-like chemotaxis protein